MRSSGGDRGEKRPQIKHLKYTPTGELPANALVIEDSLNGVRSGKAVPCVPVRLRSPDISKAEPASVGGAGTPGRAQAYH